MRAKAGAPPRTMVQKILAGRSRDPDNLGDSVDAKIDHVVVAREAAKVLAEMGKAPAKGGVEVEVAIAYDGACVTTGEFPGPELASRGVLVGRAGVGFPSIVHLERFASPARLCVTDDPRLGAELTARAGMREDAGQLGLEGADQVGAKRSAIDR